MYRIPCGGCDKVYIGETGRSLKTRITEHRRDVVNQKPESAVANHTSETGHIFKFKDSKILFHSSDQYKRHLVESALICSSDNTVNNKQGFCSQNKLLSHYIHSVIDAT